MSSAYGLYQKVSWSQRNVLAAYSGLASISGSGDCEPCQTFTARETPGCIINECCCAYHMFRCKHAFSTSSRSILLLAYNFLITNIFAGAPCSSSKRRPVQLLNPSPLAFGLFFVRENQAVISLIWVLSYTFSPRLPAAVQDSQTEGPLAKKTEMTEVQRRT